MVRKKRRRLPCGGCGLSFAWDKREGEPPSIEFPDDSRPPSPHCARREGTSACRFQVAQRRTALAADLAGSWKMAGEVASVCIFLPRRELTLEDARGIEPAAEARRLRRLIDKASRQSSPETRKALRGFGAVEPGVVEIRKRGGKRRRRMAMHGHLLFWGMPLKWLRQLLARVVESTKAVKRPLVARRAKTPRGALGYALKHMDDHRAQVRKRGRKRFKRRLEADEAEILRRWSAFPAADAEVLVGLRRGPNGIADYGAGKSRLAAKASTRRPGGVGARRPGPSEGRRTRMS